jgi:alkanesulfonate monooxygenase
VQDKRNPKFGVWAPHWGKWVVDYARETPAAPYQLIEDVIVSAERVGFDSALIAQHTVNPKNPAWEIAEAWTAAAATAAVTKRIEIIAAIKPRLYHPVVLAKMALGIEEISQGRFAINFVNAWFKPELEDSGIGFPPHDERYAYGAEWLSVVKRLISGERVTHNGAHFHIDDYRLSPASLHRQRPLIYSGGESEPARELATQLADTWLINGQPLEEVRAKIADVSTRTRDGNPLQFGLAGFVVARETDAEAESALAELVKLAPNPSQRSAMSGKIDPDAVMHKTSAKYPWVVGANGGIAPGFVGSYERVARRIQEFYDIGITAFLLSFYPLIEEQERFAREIIPRVAELIAEREEALV